MGLVSGPDAEHRSYRSFASLRDPDGKGWLFQEITTRLPGRLDPTTTTFASANDLANAFRRAEAAHGQHEKRTGQRDEIGPTGMPLTWWRSSPAKSCRDEPLERDRKRQSPRGWLTLKLQEDSGVAYPLQFGFCKGRAFYSDSFHVATTRKEVALDPTLPVLYRY